MNRMEQLIGFVEVERRNNPDKLHIADWALTEIERLTAALAAAEADAVEVTHPLLAKDMRERYELSAAAQLVPTDEIVMTKAELKEYTDHIAELERALADSDFPNDCSRCPNNPTNYPPSGFKLVAVKGFDDLLSALERASRKGYMPDAMVDEWEAFEIATVHAAAAHAAQPAQPKTLTDLQRLVTEQAYDEGLWFEARTAPEAHLQAALRQLHAAIERALEEK